MIRTLLIANRGEIACRVIATARRLGIRTVAVYSDADRDARHVAMADEAVHIGPPPASESYLNADAILAAARRAGADAIHPGYGFLSENPGFVEAVEAQGLTFVGPPASAIRAMGLKDAAKRAMEEAGVPVVPGYHGDDQDPAHLAREAEAIGYPVLIKARAGGGGKGMRLVERAGDFAAALESAQREAQAAFGDPACLIEKFVTSPRHVEIQVMADAHGTVLHLFERDCSLQRRHQKVIEEAPAPDMPEAVRAAMGRAAVEAARAIGYRGAGTVEFIADGSGPLREDGFWFMEMNTRLQVEHPVTEAITGLDLVELQLRVAAGEALPMAQEDLSIDGWAFEARLYAEDAARGFLPATGTLAHLEFPEAAEFARGSVRVDAGVRSGDEISPHYDPMIAKIITHGPTRAAALARLRQALAETQVAGTVTNLDFLSALAAHEGFGRGEVDTGLIARDQDTLTAPAPVVGSLVALAAAAAAGLTGPATGDDPWDRLSGYRHFGPATRTVLVMQGDALIAAEVAQTGQSVRVSWDEQAITLHLDRAGGELRVTEDGQSYPAEIRRIGSTLAVFASGHRAVFTLPDPLALADADAAGGDAITAPMPGLVKRVSTAPGAEVESGAALIVLEAMKMEHTLTAPRDGTVAELLVAEGDQVSDGTLLLRLEDEA
ncbi:acetyl/propionyl/methylcrotonyl-CoA carboxylase subunit alpha [Litorisediminicola beolgyonensis]|uniref:Acetyl/propionyl/methylcrotonyl-CoA carboxylase subunit alpha n=1 Tax=Litorisediminicola beolgyonensis TaxID=1173614 RepID=A0ABW3ZJD3_9RHOB